jgi:hypothetical protein
MYLERRGLPESRLSSLTVNNSSLSMSLPYRSRMRGTQVFSFMNILIIYPKNGNEHPDQGTLN